MKRSRILMIVLVLAMVVSMFSACAPKATEAKSPSTEGGSESAETATPKKLGVIYLLSAAPFYQAYSQHLQNIAEANGIELIELDGECDQAKMTTQMENLIASEVDGIIYCLLEGQSASADINAAQDKGIPVVTFAIPHDRTSADCPFVGIDEVAAGKIGGVAAGEFYLDNHADEKAQIAVVEFTGLKASTDRSDGFIEGFLSVVENAEVVARVDGKGQKDSAMAVTEDLIQTKPEINVLYGANGDQGLGALAALEAQGRGTLETELVISHDGSEPEVLMLATPDSALKFAVANQPKELSEGCFNTLMEIINGEREMKNTDNVMIPAVALSGQDLDFAQEFIATEYLSDTKIK